MREFNFDGLVGPTHHYAGLSYGNLASSTHRGEVGNPRQAALEGLEKARFVASLGVGQAVLPPQLRPNLRALRALGFRGSSREILPRVLRDAPELLALVSSSSAMWTANAATVAPSADTVDERLHFVPANLSSMFHRSLEADATTATLRALFADPAHFVVHDPLPNNALFADEGAANHTRLFTDAGSLHVFGWGRAAAPGRAPERYPARQTLEASQACARLQQLPAERVLFAQQAPEGIDGGAFHSDVLAVGNRQMLLLHELAFMEPSSVLAALRARLGEELEVFVASESELPLSEAVRSYPFNSQLVSVQSGGMVMIAPEETRNEPRAHAFLERVLASTRTLRAVHYVNVNGSMRNGGGPACLRLRVALEDHEVTALAGHALLDDQLYEDLRAWITRHYRDRVSPADLGDPDFFDENRRALAELSARLGLPIDLYD